jgi:hypothetical protein
MVIMKYLIMKGAGEHNQKNDESIVAGTLEGVSLCKWTGKRQGTRDGAHA